MAEAFSRLEPWKWMFDTQIVGLRYPATNEVLLCSILGALRSVFALMVYRNPAGHRRLLNTILHDEDWENSDLAFEQDAVKAEFVLKRELTKEDHAAIRAVGYSPVAKAGAVWPQFRSVRPGAFPWHVTEAEVDMLIFALPRVATVARLVREKPDLWESHLKTGEIAFLPSSFDHERDQLNSELIDWHPMIPSPEELPTPITLDESTIAQLVRFPRAKGFQLEIDLTFSFMIVVAEVDRPRFPRLAMAVDRASGFVGAFHLADLKDVDGAGALATVLVNALNKFSTLPESIRVQRPRVAAMLGEVADRLEIRVVTDHKLEQLNAAKESMEAFFKGRR